MKNALLILIMFCTIACSESKEVRGNNNVPQHNDTINIMSFNMWHGGDAGGQALTKSIEVIRAARGGIVGVQESGGYGNPRPDRSAEMAGNMGWRQVNQGHLDGIMTKYQITEVLESRKGVKIKLDDDKYIWFFNCHLAYIPYQPYQLANKEYGDYPFISTEEEAIQWAADTRLHQLEAYIAEIDKVKKEGWPVVLTGDFNEPSHLDWTQRAADANVVQQKVQWPCTKRLFDYGFKDAFRAANPDEVKRPGKTWSSIESPGEIHDRIDFIFVMGDQLKLLKSQTVGEPTLKSDIHVVDYPSDHRAVVASFKWVDAE
ncbi:endonuclease/exonuclease/phosphatase family protein [Carboxylicivirga mesophila]|uniref:Endonuclease/exonuclease/phosphatase family protein n=1 Tax=Carboxylicivirga mesophila TaxID=1166478 RepID=A0ABS5K4U3_9BACT|nr:endonuclease/exonuclease/phosphatase family protein [Carboxylicivirga mesophila]MBS2210026.1 endonuclease/exonuclease/phosphatase family protein [Carboxylicivirga mesophila]